LNSNNNDDIFIDLEEEAVKELEEAILDSLDDKRELLQKGKPKNNNLFIFPVNRRIFFPSMAAPIVIEKGRFYDILKKVAKSENKCLGLILTRNENTPLNNIEFDDLYDVGIMARILRIIPMDHGGAQVILSIENRFTVEKKLANKKYLEAKVSYFHEPKEFSEEIKAYAISIVNTIKKLLKLSPLFKEELQIFLNHADFTDPGKMADFASVLTTAPREDLQEVLEAFDIKKRIDLVLELLKKELDMSTILHTINEKTETVINKSQKEYYLREQLRAIKKELNLEKDEKSCDIEKFEERIKKLKIPEDVTLTIDEELDKLSVLETQSAEYSVCRGYLDWLTSIPWGLYSKDCYNLAKADKVLQKDHYGLEDTKKHILEFISVGKLSGRVHGSIICFVGPPGVGKTSIGKSIARALNRKFYRFSVGGMRDEAEIKGHRRTYVGAMPGKLIQALKYCQTMNPVIMLDEVDKLGSSFQGDPASALLEVLDSEQNCEFLDHYLDVRCDLSDVLFIVTANVLDTIPAPLRDRMDIMRLSGYILEEKIQIAKQYLIPKNRKDMGLRANQIQFTAKALHDIIDGYAREAGVRSLENHIKKIMRKVATKIVKAQEIEDKKAPKKYAVSHGSLKEYIGKPIFTTDKYYHEPPVGVAVGLAWTSLGGAIIYIEVTKVPSEKTLMQLTGQAGDVMKESSQIAWTYLHSAIEKFAPGTKFFPKSSVHVHIPEGATPKEGPSAGVTMVTALLSLLTGKPVAPNLAMTGEITLTGRVLAIGGVKEKLIAARRANIKTLIFPESNLHDYEELPDYLKKGLAVHFVKYYDEVFKIAFC
jgi:ATP-dependent Lon protease